MDLEDDIDPEVSSAKGKSKDKNKGLTEVKIEYTKRRVDENHFGPLSYAEVMAARNEEPWVVGANSNILMVQEKEVCGQDHSSTYNKYEALTQCPDESIPSSASLPLFISSMQQEAAHEYADSAVDPEWKVLSSPNYPGRVDAKEWIEKRKLRHPNAGAEEEEEEEMKEEEN